jgi:ATP-binding cassette, subfamily B, bacterial
MSPRSAPPADDRTRPRLSAVRNAKLLVSCALEVGRPLLIGTAFLRLFRSLVPLTSLWIMRLIVDEVVRTLTHRAGSNPRALWSLVVLQAGLAVCASAAGRVSGLLETLLSERVSNRLSVRLMAHCATLDLASFEDPAFQDQLERARTQVSGRARLLSLLLDTGQDFVTLLSLAGGMIFFSVWLLPLTIVAALPAFLVHTHFTRQSYLLRRRRTPERRYLDYLRFLGTSTQIAKEVRIFGLGDDFVERFRQAAQAMHAEHSAIAKRRTLAGVGLSVVAALAYLAAYALILAKATSGGISVGMFTFFAGSFSRCRNHIDAILSDVNGISEHLLFLNDLVEFMDLTPRIRALPHGLPAPRPIRRGIEFQHVSFAYPQNGRTVLRDFSCVFRPTETVALIGENGAGKTTLVKLLTRLYDPTGGRILLDGVDLRDYDPEDLHREISVVFQDFVRYNLTVRDNIGFGRVDAMMDRDRVEAAARKSGAGALIETFEDGYDQILGTCVMRRSWFSTSRRRRSTPGPSTPSSNASWISRAAAWRSSSRTASRACGWRTASWCWPTAGPSKTARTKNSWPSTASMRRSSICRPPATGRRFP